MTRSNLISDDEKPFVGIRDHLQKVCDAIESSLYALKGSGGYGCCQSEACHRDVLEHTNAELDGVANEHCNFLRSVFRRFEIQHEEQARLV